MRHQMTDIEAQLAIMGITGQRMSGDTQMLTRCPFPDHPDKKPSFSINLENGAWLCFSRCGGGSWLELITRLGADPEWAEITAAPSGTTLAEVKNLELLLDRGFSLSVLQAWGISWDEEHGAIHIPVLDAAGKSLSSLWRNVDRQPKYLYLQGFQKSHALFGAQNISRGVQEIVLVEGPLDAIWAQAAGASTVAILGASLSDAQIALLRQWPLLSRVTLCFDNDAAGRRATEAAIPKLREAGYWVFTAKLLKGAKDIQEVPLAKVRGVLSQKNLAVGSFMPHRVRAIFTPKYLAGKRY